MDTVSKSTSTKEALEKAIAELPPQITPESVARAAWFSHGLGRPH